MFMTVFQTRFPTAEPMRDPLGRAGFHVEVMQAAPGRQQVVCTRAAEQVVLDHVDPGEYAFTDLRRELFPELSRHAKGYLVASLRPGWVFQVSLEIAWLLQESGFLLDGPTKPPCVPNAQSAAHAWHGVGKTVLPLRSGLAPIEG